MVVTLVELQSPNTVRRKAMKYAKRKRNTSLVVNLAMTAEEKKRVLMNEWFGIETSVERRTDERVVMRVGEIK